jgi:hypothetical protein
VFIFENLINFIKPPYHSRYAKDDSAKQFQVIGSFPLLPLKGNSKGPAPNFSL